MKRLICLLLTALILFSICACSKKKEEAKPKETEEQKATETKQESVHENVVVDPADGENGDATEIGTLPIIFGDETENTDGGTETTPPTTTSTSGGTTTPPSTTKAPTSSTKAPTTSSSQSILGNSGTVVETPIIPFN